MAGSPDVLAGTFAGRYTIERELGSGATATVYLARDTQRGISVAVKLLRPELSQSVGADRFLREIRLNEKLHHPHIVPVLDSGEHEGRLYFVLPHMEEGSLRQLLQREKQLPIERAIEITKTVAMALDYAHQQNLIHRDVKPENILFTAGQACLADFGIARAVERAMDESTTDTGLVRGTPAYMSPEQASGSRQYDGRSDQYSLACVLYEMLAGVPAFIGPTPEAVIAMRFQHAPREVSVFRPTVSQELKDVLNRALAVAPADRYGTTAEFSAALDRAPRTPTIERQVGDRSRGLSRGQLAIASAGGIGGIAALAALAVASGIAAPFFGNRLTPADSVRYAILPIEADSALPASEAYDRLHNAFARWSGIELASRFDVREAVGTDAPVSGDPEAVAVARQLRTGRYVRARLAQAGPGFTLTAVLVDAVAQRNLHEVTAPLPPALSASAPIFDRIASTLLLRTAEETGPTSKVLPAAQLFLQGMTEQRAFRLDRADSLLTEAVERDRDFGRAALWLAQVRAWRRAMNGVDNWLPWAQRAAASGTLSGVEHDLAASLISLGRRDFEAACRTYRTMISANPNAFEAWYGLGQCQDWDRVVVPDRQTASGWRFRSSYHQAVRAYTRAFELAPSMHRNFEPRAFSQLRIMLYAGRAITRPGVAASPDTMRFLAYAEWSGDSLVFIPYPFAILRGGGVTPNRAARTRATLEQQRLFARIARTWSAAFPRNASAKEAVAVALEMAGDPAALDTIRHARGLAGDDEHRLRLAVEEIIIRVSLGRRGPGLIQAAARLADSVLSAHPSPTVEQARLLGPVAALRGKCRLSGRYAALVASPGFGDFPDIPRTSLAAADSLSILAVLGCITLDPSAVNDVLATAASGTRTDSASLPRLEYSLFARALAFAPAGDTARLGRVARATGDYLLRANYDIASGNPGAVRDMLTQRQSTRGPSGTTDVTPDAVFPETRLWLALGDSAMARRWPDPMLRRPSWLEYLLEDSYAAASIMRLALLRAELAHATSDAAQAAQWGAFVRQLWAGADLELSSSIQGLKP